jgi:hypothetical protein
MTAVADLIVLCRHWPTLTNKTTQIVAQSGSPNRNYLLHCTALHVSTYRDSRKMKLTNCIEQSSSEGDIVDQLVKKFCLLWNPKVHYHVHQSAALFPVHSQVTQSHPNI